jgi:hypothetical protein
MEDKYISKQKIGVNSTASINAISENSRKLWSKDSYREMQALNRSKQSGNISSIQKTLYKYLDDLNIVYDKEGPNTTIGYYVFDCLIPSKNGKSILIECQGDYWHSLPKHERNDKSKFTYISKYFPQYEIMYIWEHEFNAKGRVLDRLKLKLGIDIKCVDFKFDDIEIKTPPRDELKSFLNSYHYIGTDRGGILFGAYLEAELIGVVVFSSPLRQNTASQFGMKDSQVRELSRFCIHPNYHKKNFASWLISKTLKMIDCDLVVAYSDKTVGHGGYIYKASNFELHHTVQPDYWYADNDGYVMHKRTLYGKASKMSMSESDYAEKYGYRKIFGGEKLCFIKKLN